MDSITHLFYGGAIAAAIAPPRHRRAALLAGAALNTLPDLDVSRCPVRRSGCADDLPSRHDAIRWLVLPFVAWAIWAFFRAPRWARRATAATLVLGHLRLPDGASVDRFVHRLRHATVVAAADAAADVVEPVHHRSAVHIAVAARVRDRMVRTRSSIRRTRAGRGHRARRGLRRLVAGREIHRRSRGRPCARRDRAGRCAALFGADAVQHAAVAGGGDDAERLRRRIPLAGGRSRADDVPRLSVQRAGARASARRPGRASAWPGSTTASCRRGSRDGELVLGDLRMGSEPDYFFRFAVARREGAQWQAIRPRQLETPRAVGSVWSTTWHRIWHAPAAGAPVAVDRDTRKRAR